MDSSSFDDQNDSFIISKLRNDLIYRAQAPAIIVVCIVVLGFSFSLAGNVPTINLVVWTAACLISYVVRLLLFGAYTRAPEQEQSSVSWQVRFSLASCVSGLIWGLAAFTLFPEDSVRLQLLLILIIVFLAAATTVTHSGYKWASLGFSSCSLLPTALHLFLDPAADHVELSGLVVGFWFVMCTSSFYLEKVASRMFELTATNAKLVSDLTQKNDKLGESNHRLAETKAELSKANDALQKLVTTDALTGLTNRRRFDALAKLKWQRCAEAGQPLSLLIINIDNFKQYNDVYGHRKGDTCLLSIAGYLSGAPEINRTGDCVARYSGDEFAVLLVDADRSYATTVAKELRRGIEMLRIPCSDMPGGVSPWASASIGVATENEFRHNSFQDLLELTDKAMYVAKRSGRNRVFTHGQTQPQPVNNGIELNY